MAFGFTPKFEQTYDLNGLSPRHYLVIALETATSLSWDVGYKSRHGLVAYIGGGMFSTAEEFTLVIRDGMAQLTSKTISREMADMGRNKKRVNEFVERFDHIRANFSDEELDQRYQELAAAFPMDNDDPLLAPPPTAKQNFQSFLSFFVPHEGFYITPVIIDLNIIVFILMAAMGVSFFEPQTQQLILWGGNFRASTLSGEWWRLLSNIFVHAGIFHLLLNMYALLYIGLLLEPYLGKVRFAAAYLLTGVLASLTSIYWHPITVSVGASGAIFGMYGVFLAMLTTNFIDKSVRKALMTSIAVFVVINLANGVKEGIDAAAHIGGLISGIVIGYAFYPSLKKPADSRTSNITIVALTLVTIIVTCIGVRTIPNDIGEYDTKMNLFIRNEDDALKVFRDKDKQTQVILAKLTTGTKDWNDNLRILNEVEKLDLPDVLKARDKKLRTYCNLRIKSYDLITRSVSGNTNAYKDSIMACNKQIEDIITELKGR